MFLCMYISVVVHRRRGGGGCPKYSKPITTGIHLGILCSQLLEPGTKDWILIKRYELLSVPCLTVCTPERAFTTVLFPWAT